MADNASRKLVVQVCNAKNLMPKDGQGTASAYAVVDFDGQRRRTKTKMRDLNPEWDETLEYSVHDSESMASEMLEVNLYNDKKTGKRSTFLGKVKVSGSSFAKSGSEVLVYYPLEKRSVFSQIRGELGLKIFYVDEEEKDPPVEQKLAGEAPAPEEKPASENAKETVEEKKEEKTEETKSTEKEEETEKNQAENPKPAVSDDEKTKKDIKEDAERTRRRSSDLVALNELRELRSGSRVAYDLVQVMPFLFVRMVKAKREQPPPPADDQSGASIIYAKLSIGTHTVKTNNSQIHKDWDQVFAFDKDGLNSTSLQVSVWEQGKDDPTNESCLGNVSFDLHEVPKRVPPDSPLAPQWYSLESEKSPVCDVMLAVWMGTQADEAFQEAWQSDSGGLIPETRAKVYLSPKLWYLRLTVIQTQDLQFGSGSETKARNRELQVKGKLGAQVFKTSRTSAGPANNPTWNEDLIFVTAEPFDPFLTVTVDDFTIGEQPIGHAQINVASMERRLDDRVELKSRWFNLIGDEKRPYAGRIHLRVCLEGGYHVADEAAHVTSDVTAAAKQLTKPPVGLVEVGIRGATNLLPVKRKDGTCGSTSAYVVAKYGAKWVRTRTIIDRFNPRWNEQYTWDVQDPCTVLTIGVFNNGSFGKKEAGEKNDLSLGKIRVRLSTLDVNRVYRNTYTLTVLHPDGPKKMGEIEIAVRFSCPSWLSLIQAYTTPILPRMHYVRPLGPAQQDILRHTAMRIVTARLGRSEPPLGQEVVHYLLDSESHVWSLRRSKANWFRVVGCLTRVASLARWLDGIRTWAHPPTTVLVHVLLVAVVLWPHLLLPTVFMYAFLILLIRYRYRHRVPPSLDPRLSYVDGASGEELDEEFDPFPTGRSFEQIRVRYDRLRALAGRAQTLLGDVASQGERLDALLSWKDPRATGIVVVLCLLASLVLYVVPFKAFVLGSGLYYLRHPRFRDDMPSVAANIFRRLPSLSDQIM